MKKTVQYLTAIFSGIMICLWLISCDTAESTETEQKEPVAVAENAEIQDIHRRDESEDTELASEEASLPSEEDLRLSQRLKEAQASVNQPYPDYEALEAKETAMLNVQGGEFAMWKDTVALGVISQLLWVDDFELARYKVTVREWKDFLAAVPEAYFYESWDNDLERVLSNNNRVPEVYPDNWPIMGVLWYEALLYANWRSEVEGLTPVYDAVSLDAVKLYRDALRRDTEKYIDVPGPTVTWNRDADGYRLPTEAEWHYAAIGGQLHVPLWGREDITDYAWVGEDPTWSNLYEPEAIGLKKPNALGFYDMIGLAREWVWDYASDTYADLRPYRNPTGPEESVLLYTDEYIQEMRVSLGACFWMQRQHSVKRYTWSQAAVWRRTTGFRLARGPVLNPDGEN